MRSRNSLSFKALSLARNSREFDAGFGFALNVADVRPLKPTRRSKLDKNPDSATARSLVRRNGFFALTPNIRRGHPLSNACANAPVRRGDTINWVGGNLFSSSYATPSGRCGDKETAFAGVSFGRFRDVFRFHDNNSIVVAATSSFYVDLAGDAFPIGNRRSFQDGRRRRERSIERQRDARTPQTRPVGAIGGRGALKYRR